MFKGFKKKIRGRLHALICCLNFINIQYNKNVCLIEPILVITFNIRVNLLINISKIII